MSKGPWNRTLPNPILPALSYCPYSARDFRNTHRHTSTDCNYCTLFRNTCANFSSWSFASVDPLFLHGDLLQQFCKGKLILGEKTPKLPIIYALHFEIPTFFHFPSPSVDYNPSVCLLYPIKATFAHCSQRNAKMRKARTSTIYENSSCRGLAS